MQGSGEGALQPWVPISGEGDPRLLSFAMNNKLNGLYVITDEELSGRTHVEIARAATAGGARIMQIRDKNASDRAFYEAALAIRKLTTDAGAWFFVNDRVHIAAAVGADGVNVGQTDLPVRPCDRSSARTRSSACRATP